jgi:urease alpha subunit
MTVSPGATDERLAGTTGLLADLAKRFPWAKFTINDAWLIAGRLKSVSKGTAAAIVACFVACYLLKAVVVLVLGLMALADAALAKAAAPAAAAGAAAAGGAPGSGAGT